VSLIQNQIVSVIQNQTVINITLNCGLNYI